MKESNPIADVPLSPVVSSTPDIAKRKRGFAVMNPEQVRELARRGGASAHRLGTAHEFTSEEARAAGRKGGSATHSRTRTPL
jgi:general stress protein YciG